MPYLKKIFNLPRNVVTWFITIYQHTLSPDHGPLKARFPNGFCRYRPTCSEYGKQAIKKYGIIIGGLKAAWRVIRCNPWSGGGIDEVE